jgi:hypothetical protein
MSLVDAIALIISRSVSVALRASSFGWKHFISRTIFAAMQCRVGSFEVAIISVQHCSQFFQPFEALNHPFLFSQADFSELEPVV